MVSGFLISPYDQDRIFSGLAIEMRIWSKTCAGTCGLKRFINSWFILVSSLGGISPTTSDIGTAAETYVAQLVMPGLVPGIYALTATSQGRRGWPGHRRAKRPRPSDGYARP